MNKLLAEKLRSARINRNFKQLDVAEFLGVKKNTISNWENGKANPDIDSLVKLCEFYNISCSSILEEAYPTQVVHSLSICGLEREIILAYRNADELGKAMVLRSLGLDNKPVKGDNAKMA
ncbi:MAG: helix-turn-helix transcriptional regulator [Lachnospiraceae bacterium]|nr:helix-turn-helix transcriptional regulator [Lachnospiraceae bacterium]MBD5482114.1 helix-turn-helix transcriptional regulator [Lachnospiraceae bacterium]